ncbi:hypothetical protein M2G84_23190, partial [Vibrio vulnificus]|nr:hypothetical protein [Vibrio vulnificus]
MKLLLFFIWAKYEPFWVRYQLKVVSRPKRNDQQTCYGLRDPLINPPVHSHLLRAAQLEPWPL